ncbi:hypothetical protein CPB84DRAFT_1852938 [Gymnopilus junonius]|uniref:FAR1 domain-containing protein n=1 Tax=Gymnopilus junonius TaxID=109634 RepID=A0A9P5N9I1_GYMJU|nr:hypothetical protein CPB84DRAFT_1852938 [Gymnopilus junonius]
MKKNALSKPKVKLELESDSEVEFIESISFRKESKLSNTIKQESVIDLSATPPKPCPTSLDVISLSVTPPRPCPTSSLDVIDLCLTLDWKPVAIDIKPDKVKPAPGIIKINSIFNSLEDAQAAIYAQEERLGHIWRRAQSKSDDNGVIKKMTFRCNHYDDHKPVHSIKIDPSDHREGKSIRTGCKAHVNVNRISASNMWHITLINWDHNHSPAIPDGAPIHCHPTIEQRQIVSGLATSASHNFSHGQLDAILKVQTGTSLEPCQIAQYPLDISVSIDSHGSSCNLWYCFHAIKDQEHHNWVLKCHLESAASVAEVLPTSEHFFCIQHLDGNVDQNLHHAIPSDDWQSFKNTFWDAYHAVSPEEFDKLYPCRRQWAWAFTSHKFTCGVQTNGRVEVKNRVTKAFGGPKKSLKQLFDALNERTDGQDVKELIWVRDVST